MKLICPCCHAITSLESHIQDEAARDLLALRGEVAAVAWPHLVAYIGLFRSPSRALAWDRALRLAREVLEIPAAPNALATALAETVEAMRQKRTGGSAKPLANHNYLLRVLETVNSQSPMVNGQNTNDQGQMTNNMPKGKRAQAVAALRQWAGGDWLRRVVSDGLEALVADNRKGAPGADTITATAGLWETMLRSSGCAVEMVDTERIYKAFTALLKEVEGWPECRDLIARLPHRPRQEKLPEREISDEERGRIVAELKKITEKTAEGMDTNG